MLKLRKLGISKRRTSVANHNQMSGKKRKRTISECNINMWNKGLVARRPHRKKTDLDPLQHHADPELLHRDFTTSLH